MIVKSNKVSCTCTVSNTVLVIISKTMLETMLQCFNLSLNISDYFSIDEQVRGKCSGANGTPCTGGDKYAVCQDNFCECKTGTKEISNKCILGM